MKKTLKCGLKQTLVMSMAVVQGALVIAVPDGWPFALVVALGFLLGSFWYDLTKWSLEGDETND